eukprot:5874786-Pyramimonas_sp.AAC.1
MTPLDLMPPRPTRLNRAVRVARACAVVILPLAVLVARLSPMEQSTPRSLAQLARLILIPVLRK